MFDFENVKYKDILKIEKLHIEKNEITCIVGESGSGKTTLLKLFNKIISQDSGEIMYKGKSVDEYDSVILRREVVMLPQTPAIYEGSIKENLIIGLRFSEKKEEIKDERLNGILKEIHLNKSLNEDGEKLSGGEKQRLTLGRIILLEPEVYLLDEPSSSLDEKNEYMIIEKMVSIARKKDKTLIMVTHSKAIAEKFADTIIELKDGKILNGGGNSYE